MLKIKHPFGEISFDLQGATCEIEVVNLETRTDTHNNVVVIETVVPLKGEAAVNGKIFFVKDFLLKTTWILISLSPDMARTGIVLKNGRIRAEHCNFPIAYGSCALGTEERELRCFFAGQMKNKHTYVMANNWGDCNRGHNIDYDFYYKEIDVAQDLGIDAVQIDDGWQCGSTVETRIYKENGAYTFYHDFYDGFWEPDTTKFPRGLIPLIEYANKRNVKLGLWFAPDSREEFKNFERDIAVLQKAYCCGFRYFKLDMVVIKSYEDSKKFLEMLRRISAFGSDVSLQIDVTGDIERLGFLCGFEYGKIFVENRSCKDREYYPHTTLKNLWKLSRYMPAQLFQFEVPNHRNFSEYYREDDLLAPVNYSSDYLFASVLVSNPLLWMEVQNLEDDDKSKIKHILKIWESHRIALSNTDIIPIGNEPNGSALTGFLCIGGHYGYVVAIREVCEREELKIDLPPGMRKIELLASSDGIELENDKEVLRIRFTDYRQYAFCRFEG